MAAAGSYISRYYGDFAHRVENITSPTRCVSLFHVVASDGSRFIVGVDKWGNAGGVVESHGYETPERTAALVALVAEMDTKASAS